MRKDMQINRKLKVCVALALTAFISVSMGKAQQKGTYRLKERPFFTDVFDYDALDDFDKAKEKEERGNELKGKADERYQAAKQAMERKEAATSSGVKNKARRRHNWKTFWAQFFYRRALKKYHKADDIRYEVYADYISDVRLDDGSKYEQKALALEGQAEEHYRKGMRMMEDLPDDRAGKIAAMERADSLKKRALQQMNLAYGVHQKDSAALKLAMGEDELARKDEPDKEEAGGDKLPDVQVPPFEQNYGYKRDPYIYRSIKGKLYRKLNLNPGEWDKLDKAYKKVEAADSLYQEINATYRDIIRKKRMAKKATSQNHKENLKSAYRNMEMNVFEDMIAMAEKYVAANKTFFRILNTHFSELDSARNTYTNKEADRLASSARSIKNRADSMMESAISERFRSERYRMMMTANRFLHEAMQSMEAAYAIKLDMQKAQDNMVSVFDIVSGEITVNDKAPEIGGQEGDKGKKASYTFAGRYKMNAQGNAVKAAGTDGLVFRIQAGIMRELPKKGKAFMPPVHYDTFKDNPFRRYYLGEFKSLEASEYARNMVRDTLYKDAFVVPFLNGKRISEGYARQLIDAEKFMPESEYLQIKSRELAALGDETARDKTGQRVHVAGRLEDTKGLVFTVQLGIFDDVPYKSQVADVDTVFRGKTPIGKRYTLSWFDTYANALKIRNKVATNGLKKAFVVAYNDGAWIDINKARGLYELKEEPQPAEHKTSGKVVYRVEIGAFDERGRFEQLRKRIDLKEIEREDGKISYNVGAFQDYSKALDKRDELLSSGVEGYVVAYKGESRITLTEAKEKNEAPASVNKPSSAKDTAKQKAADDEKLYFSVQVGSFTNPLSREEQARLDNASPKWDLFEKRGENGRYMYNLGRFAYFEEARSFQENLETEGVNGFIVGYLGNKRLMAEEARKVKLQQE